MDGTESASETLPQPLLLPDTTTPAPQPVVPLPEAKPGNWRLIFQVGSANRIVSLEITDQIIIGRSDPDQQYIADLDLTPFNGRAAGVSRRHVILYLSHDMLYIRDLGSANGTEVNGIWLEPQHLYRLNEGDRISLGKLDLLLFFARPLS
jgi:hypothetical protein